MTERVTKAIERMVKDACGNPRVGSMVIPVATLRQWIALIHRERLRQWEFGYETGYAWGREDKPPYVEPDGSMGTMRCPRCGGDIEWVECAELGCDDGMINVYADDPINNDRDDEVPCELCAGAGGWWRCCNWREFCQSHPPHPTSTMTDAELREALDRIEAG